MIQYNTKRMIRKANHDLRLQWSNWDWVALTNNGAILCAQTAEKETNCRSPRAHKKSERIFWSTGTRFYEVKTDD